MGGYQPCWDDLNPFQQADVIGFDQVARHDEIEHDINLAGGRAKPGSKGRKSPKK